MRHLRRARRDDRHGRSHARPSGRDAALRARVPSRRSTFAPGDVAIVNDPFGAAPTCPTSPPSPASSSKHAQAAAFYVASRAHHADVGGMSPGSMPLADEIYQEGLRLPPMLLVRGAARSTATCCASSWPTSARPTSAKAIFWRSVHGHAPRRGPSPRNRRPLRAAPPDATSRRCCDYTERMMRAALRRLPEGGYGFEDCLDDDGIGTADPRPRRRHPPQGDRAIVDFTGSSPQVAGSGQRQLRRRRCRRPLLSSAASSPTTSPQRGPPPPHRHHRPRRHGRQRPAARRDGGGQRRDFPAHHRRPARRARPGRAGPHPRRQFRHHEQPQLRRLGHAPGPSPTTRPSPEAWAPPRTARAVRRPYPHDQLLEHAGRSLRTRLPGSRRAYTTRRGSGGQGRYPGGDGIVRELRFLEDAEVTILSDRRARGPWGLAGGESGAPGRNTLIDGTTGEERTLDAKTRVQFRRGDVLRIESPGGGGWGQP